MISILKKLKKSIGKTIKFYKISSDKSLLDALSFFNLRFFYSYPFFRKFFKGKNYYLNKNKKLNDQYLGLEIDQGLAVKDLLDNGISKKFIIFEKVVEKLINNYISNEEKIENLDVIKKKLVENKYSQNLNFNGIDNLINLMEKNKISYIKYSEKNISSELKRLILSDTILSIVKNYLNNSDKILVNNEFVVSVKNNDLDQDELKKNSAQFHRDIVSHNFLKVFVYLNDVDESNGAHVYLKDSHKNNRIGNVLRYYSDYELKEAESFVEHVSGKKGSIFFEDTFGLHKGGIISNGYRLMLILTYYTPMQHQLKSNNHYLIS